MNYIIFTELFHGIQLFKFITDAYKGGFSGRTSLTGSSCHPEELIIPLIWSAVLLQKWLK